MEYKIGVCDEDYHYVVNLMEYVNSNRLGKLTLVAFSTLSAIEEYISNNYLDGVLIGDSIPDQEELIREHPNLLVIRLTGYKELQEGIYKYQNARAIISQLMEKLNVCEAPMPVEGNVFYGVYSPVGRCGKTTLAKALATFYPGSLYVSLEEYGARDSLGEEILYHIIFQNPKLHSLIDKIGSNQEGLKEVKGILSYMDIRQLTLENVLWLKEQLLVGGNYNRVVFDIGVSVLSDLNILHAMDRIYVPVLEDEATNVKLHAFREVLRCREYGELSKKLKYLEVPICHYASDIMWDYIRKGVL